jgi:hypothetical protein
MDVFKYLRKADAYLAENDESQARKDAERAGGVTSKFGRYYDSKGQYVGQVRGDKFFPASQEPLTSRMANSPAGQAETEKEKTLSDFRKDAPKPEEIPSVTDQQAKNVPGGPSATALESGDKQTVKKMLARGRESAMSAKRKAQIDQQADDMIAQADAEAEEQAAAEAEQQDTEQAALEKEMGTPQGRVKEPEEFKTLNQAVIETGKNLDGSEARGDVDIATEESIQRVTDIANADVDDQRFDSGRKANKEFQQHYSQDSEYRSGLNTLSKSVAKANDRTKVNEMMDAINEGDYLKEIQLTKTSSKTVSELLLDAGIDVNDEEQVKQFAKAYEEISSFIGEDGYWKRGESHELVGSNLGYYEAKHIAERDDLNQLDPEGIQTKAFNLASENESALANMDPTITDAVFSILPTPSRDFLSKSGSPKTFYNPNEKNQQSKTANPIRGSAALHMWAMQDGKDAYALSGQRRSPGEFQVEHIVPLKSGGKDHIDNFGMLLRRVNEPRADLGFDKFQEQAKRKRDSIDSDLSSPKTRARLEKNYRASSFNSQLAPSLGGSVSSLISDDLMNSVNSGLESKLGKASSQKLKVTSEAFKEYQTKMSDFLEKNELASDAQVKDMNSDQINGVFDIMSENLGVDKTKMNDYMGRNLINNYDVGARYLISKDGKLERGRGGTSPSSGNIINMQNSIMSDDSLSPEDKTKAIQTANEHHQKFKKTRNDYIDNPDSPEAYENYLSDVATQIDFLTGEGDSPLKPGRQYDNRLTPSSKNNIDNDTTNGILSLLSLDTASVTGGKDAFSPGFQKTSLTPGAQGHIKSLRKKLISSYTKSSGFSEDQIMNSESLTKTQRKKIEPIVNALENIDRGLGQ